MKIPDCFISCDWGTSNFRLRLVETKTLNVLVEHKTDQGVKNVYQKFWSFWIYENGHFFLKKINSSLTFT